MDKTIETAFFKAFWADGVVYKCFIWLQHKYDLGFKNSPEDEVEPKLILPKFLQEYYDTTLPQTIRQQTAGFDDSVIGYMDSPLIDEIANNLDSLTGLQRESYIFSLLKPFKTFSDEIYPGIYPGAVIARLMGKVHGIDGISDKERALAIWEKIKSESTDNKVVDNAEKQANACRHSIETYNYRIKRANYVASKYREIRHIVNKEQCVIHDKYGTYLSVEYCFNHFFDLLVLFATRLDAILLERGINLLWYQKECGIYLLYTSRKISSLGIFIGSDELTTRYIDAALPKTDQPQQETDDKTTDELKETPHQKEIHGHQRGRKKTTFKDCITAPDKEKVLRMLRNLISGKEGKYVALIIRTCIQEGIIQTPTFQSVENEFGDIGHKSGYNRYMNSLCYTDDEKDGAKKALQPILPISG